MSVGSSGEGYLSRFVKSAWGGAVVGGALMAWSKFDLPGSSETARTLKEFEKAVATPEPVILVPVLFISLVMLALSGVHWVEKITRFVVRPALRFSSDFCATAAGAMAPFALVHFRSNPADSLMAAVFGLLVAGCAGKVFDMAASLHEAAADKSLEDWRKNLLSWIGLLGSVVMGLSWLGR